MPPSDRRGSSGRRTPTPRKGAPRKGAPRKPAASDQRGAKPHKPGRKSQGSGGKKGGSQSGRPKPASAWGERSDRGGRSGARRSDDSRSDNRGPRETEEVEQIKGWGDLASKGASNLRERDTRDRKQRPRQVPTRPKPDVVKVAEDAVARGTAPAQRERPRLAPDQAWPGEPDDQPPVPEELPEKPTPSVKRGGTRRPRREPKRGGFVLDPPDLERGRELPPEVRSELGRALGGETGVDKAAARLARAAQAYERGRWLDALKDLRWLSDHASTSAAVRELHGLTLYQLGRWKQAVTQLEAFAQITGDVDQHPVLADCHRALGHHRRVAELWEQLRLRSPDAATVIEGRIVAAGALADRGELASAIAMLESGPVAPKRPKEHHLRLWYALADLYERAGELQMARDWFSRVAAAEPDFVDVSDRLAQLD